MIVVLKSPQKIAQFSSRKKSSSCIPNIHYSPQVLSSIQCVLQAFLCVVAVEHFATEDERFLGA